MVNRNIHITNEIFVKSFDKDIKEDDEAYAVVDSDLNCRSRVKLASKIIAEYENCQEYTPRIKKSANNQTKKSTTIEEEMQVESIPEEEVTKIVVEGTHDYPSGPGMRHFPESLVQVFLWVIQRLFVPNPTNLPSILP